MQTGNYLLVNLKYLLLDISYVESADEVKTEELCGDAEFGEKYYLGECYLGQSFMVFNQ